MQKGKLLIPWLLALFTASGDVMSVTYNKSKGLYQPHLDTN